MNMQYCYLVERKKDGQQYVMYGDLKQKCIGISYLFKFVGEGYKYAKTSPFGLRCNLSCGLKYNSNDYRVVSQVAEVCK